MPVPDFSASPSAERGTGVRLEGITKRFGKFTVFDDLRLEVSAGELFSLVGPSGSGKTTLLRIIAGLETHDSGHVYIGGKPVDHLGPAKRNVGMVFQDYALYPNKSVLENIASPLMVKGAKKQDAVREATEMAALLGIGETVDRKPGQISGGQQQRVALARALVKKPDVFLLDEPFSNLDAQLRFSSRKFLKDVQRRFGITTIYVTHDQEEALSISDRVAVLSEGRAEQVGTPAEIYNRPRTPFVASFVGTVNQIDAMVVSAAEGTVRCGERVMAVDGDLSDRPEGSEVAVYLRPEDVGLVTDQGADRDATSGKVRSLTFLGPVTRVGVDCGLGQLVADVASDAALHLGVGDPVGVVVEPGRLRTLASA